MKGECYDLMTFDIPTGWTISKLAVRSMARTVQVGSWDLDECNVGPTKSLTFMTFILLVPGAEQGCHALRLFQHTELEHTPSNLYQEAIMGFLS